MEKVPGLWREKVMIAATDSGLVPMRVSKAVALGDGDYISEFVVLDELDGGRHLVIGVGHAEAFALDASLQGVQWGRPMTHQFTAAGGCGKSGWTGPWRALMRPPSRSTARRAWAG
jgi:hypothetical protein